MKRQSVASILAAVLGQDQINEISYFTQLLLLNACITVKLD